MKWISIVAFILLAWGVNPQTAQRPSEPAEVSLRQLNVGQGDAMLLTTPNGRRILIDAGPNAYMVASILRNEAIDTVDLIVASHAHADHIGGLPTVFATVAVREFMDNGIPHTTATYRRTIVAVETEPGLQYLEATDRTITVDSVKFRVLPPPRTNRSQNNNSVGLLIEFGEFRALYTGDSEKAELSRWLGDNRIPAVTLLKAAHHGAANGVTREWIQATSPRIVVIPVGSRNGYGHPSPLVVHLWTGANAQVYRTDQMGEIEVRARRDGTFAVNTSVNRAAFER